jgi:uncharacterized protein (DUF1330 family)
MADTAVDRTTTDPRGYVLVRRNDHPAADIRGYVYQHRLVMEKVLGRPLTAGERVRHRDGDPGNNRAENLILVTPLDRQAVRQCACGCGSTMTVLDQSGRERNFVTGHNGVRRRSVGSRHRPKCETAAGLPKRVKENLLELFEGLCAYGCGRPWREWDHLIPWCDGGSFKSAGNAVPACRSCNLKKSAAVDPWPWIDRGLMSNQAIGWETVLFLALDWGTLEVPGDEIPEVAGV